MKPILSSTAVRCTLHGATLLLTFSLGLWVNRPTSPQTVLKPVPTSSGRSSSASAPLSPAEPTKVDTPAATNATSAPSSALKTDGINGRFALMIERVEQLNLQQTLSALRKLDGAPDEPEARIARQLLVTHFAEQDPETALTYVDTLDGDEHVQQKINAMSTWASKDGQAAAEHFASTSLQAGLIDDDAARTAAAIANEWAHRDPQAAWQWAASLPEEARDQAVRRVAAQLAATDPKQAVQAVNSLAVDDRPAAMQALATQWAEASPTQVATWVTTIPHPDQQAQAASGLISTWMTADPMAASAWVSRLYPGKTRDAAITSMVQAQSLRNDPQAATLWAASVQDKTLRADLVAQSVKRWNMHDPDAASAWLATNSH